MSDVVIQVDHLWKKYRLGVLGTGTLRHDFNRWLHRTLGKPDPYAKVGEIQKAESRKQKSASDQTSQFPLSALPEGLRDDEMWALRDISFEVKQGEILGIIGRNGAGKSTLLKILSRVTAPTAGEIRVKGRIASLLEVGTGFHPELTGRENIFLNGAILGMTKAEIKSKLDEIVSFAEVEKFLDTPVKRYSSGMYVRLAFAVAAHLEPEILIVDEVLAVGDAQFQKKCLGKMGEVAQGGRTVLFVSHNMAAIQNLCQRALLLRDGYLADAGETAKVIMNYMAAKKSASDQDLNERGDREGNGCLRFTGLRMRIADQNDSTVAQSGSAVCFELDFKVGRPIVNPIFYLGIYDLCGTQLLHMNTRVTQCQIGTIDRPGRVTCSIPRLPLPPGQYQVNVSAAEQHAGMLDRIENAKTIRVDPGDYYGTGDFSSANYARFLTEHSWRCDTAGSLDTGAHTDSP